MSVLISGWANTVQKDRVGDIIETEAWQSNNNQYAYAINPILLWQHKADYPIGRVVRYAITKSGLYIEADIHESPFAAQTVIPGIQAGAIKAFSVGFRLDEARKANARAYSIRSLELLEISVVSIPANAASLFTLDSAEARAKRTFGDATVIKTMVH